MQRRNFFKGSALALLGTSFFGPLMSQNKEALKDKWKGKKAKNIIFMVSDGMSTGTLNMANLMLQRKEGRQSQWMKLYEPGVGARALMDTASANSLVTDSAAGSSAWGGGVRVNNGALNVSADGTFHKPILQKFKAAGKSVGCVTTVPITHATPAGFCINNASRGDQNEIALQYLPLKFDVMMGGGLEFFSPAKRKDKQDVFQKFIDQGYTVIKNKAEMLALPSTVGKPVLGVFHEDGLPYTLDWMQDVELQRIVPTLAEMTQQAIGLLKQNKEGFVMQVEGGKVDWGAHSNDTGALIYDQMAFDDAVKVAIDFAMEDGETLVIMTSDHGNANPGLFYEDANRNFDKIQHFKHTNDWILKGINKNFSVQQVRERIEAAQGIAFKTAEAQLILDQYTNLNGDGLYNPDKLPFKELAVIQSSYTSVGWGSMEHSADYVELAIFGPGSELLKPFVKNTDLHNLMLESAGVKNLS